MDGPRIKIAVTFFLISVILPPFAYPQEMGKTIVVFSAFNANNPAIRIVIEGARHELSAGNYNIVVEPLDFTRFPENDHVGSIVNLYNEKQKVTPADLLVLFGPSVYRELKSKGLKILDTTPTIIIDNEGMSGDSAHAPLKENQIRFNLEYNCNKTLRTAFELFPHNKDVYVISGVAGIDNYFTELVRRETGYFIETHNFIYVTGISMDSTLRFVDRIPNNSIVLVPNYQMDINMVSYSTPEVLGMIAQHSKAPVFMLPETFGVNKGGVGGYVFSYYEVGKETGRIAKQILNGTPIKDITVNKNRFYRYAYDWQELKKWGLVNSRLIPRNSTIYNEPWLLKYKKYALGMILFLGGIIMLVIYLIGRNKKLKMLSERILETEKMYRELIREDRMAKMTELTASLSHELNQPLTAILFSAQAGKRFLQSGKLDQAQAEQILDNIIEDDKRAGGIISSVRSLMKLEHREKEKVDLNEVIRETADIYHNDAVRQNIKMIIKCNAEKAYILADKIQLQQVLMNFIRNAEIAMENTDPANKKLEVISAVDKGFITVSVRDSGPGIDSAIKERIFEPFVTTRKGGTGIGLALSRSIIEAHDGKIWAENLPDGGADFSFRLNLLKNG